MNMVTIFIPPCTNSLCEDRLNALEESLSKEDFIIEENIYAGSKTKHFEDSIKKCSLTVLHKCPNIWKFISIGNLDTFLVEEKDLKAKILCVQFDGLSYDIINKDESYRQRFDIFFEDLNMQDISTEIKLQKCLNYIKSLIKKITNTHVQRPKLKPKSVLKRCISHGFDYARLRTSTSMESKEKQLLRMLHSLRKKDMRRSSNEHGSFYLYPSEYATIKVFARVMNSDEIETNQLNIYALKTFEELKGNINEELNSSKTALNSFQFLLHTALPHLYTVDMLYGLVTIATCDDPDLQKNAINYAELLVLKGRLHTPDTDLRMLLTLKNQLIESIEQMWQIKTENNNLKELIRRKCSLLYSVEVEILLRNRRVEEFDSSNLKLKAEDRKSNTEKYITATQEFLSLTTDERKQFSECLFSQTQRKSMDCANLITEKDYKQYYIIMQQFKKIFKGNDEEDIASLEFLESYLKTKYIFRGRHFPPLCIELILRGILQYLTYLTKESVKDNIADLCSKALLIVGLLMKKNCSLTEILKSLRIFMFCSNDEIRQQVLEFVKSIDDLNEPIEKHITHILEELFPALNIDNDDKVFVNQVDTWLQIPGHFMDDPVRIFIHKPTETNHMKHNKTDFVNYADLMMLKNINLLSKMQHTNIITLYAYNLETIPQFYILEHHFDKQCNNLQNYLVNGRQKKRWCSMSTLLKLLCDAAVAIEFCHLKNIILRDITAASFIVTQDNSVKLSSFSLAIDLGKKCEIIDAIGDHFLIPTRWSAPESLRRYKWSKMSDLWMFGHLIYEVVTHGVMPYSHLNITDDEFKEKICLSAIKLKHEECIAKELYDVVSKCTTTEATERINMSKLKHLLGQNKKNTKSLVTNFPSVTSEQGQLATQFSKGIPKINVDVLAGVTFYFHRDLSSSLKQYKSQNRYLFYQCIKRHYPKTLLDEISDGKLDGIIPFVEMKKLNDKEFKSIIRIPVHLEGNILELVFNEKLGKTDSQFKNLLLKIARLLDSIHKLNFILGSLRPSQLFVHFMSENDYKIFPVSLAYLHILHQSSMNRVQQDDPVAVVRSAPEVTEKNMFSEKSDVFQFGVLILELFQARAKVLKAEEFSEKTFDELESEFNLDTIERPINMETKLFNLIEKCISTDSASRHSMETIIRILSPKDEVQSTKIQSFAENIKTGEDSEQMTDNSISHSKTYHMNPINISETSDYNAQNDSEVASNLGSEYFRNNKISSVCNYPPSEEEIKIIPETTLKEIDTYDDTYDPGKKTLTATNNTYSNFDYSDDNHFYEQFNVPVTKKMIKQAQSDSELVRNKSFHRRSCKSCIMRSHNYPVSIINRPHTTNDNLLRHVSNKSSPKSISASFGYLLHLAHQQNEKSYNSISNQAAGNKQALDHKQAVHLSKSISARSDHIMQMTHENDERSPYDLLKDETYDNSMEHLI